MCYGLAGKGFWGIASLVVIVILVISLILNGVPATSSWSASSSTTGVSVQTGTFTAASTYVATGTFTAESTYVTTNWLGQVTTATTSYVTTGTYTATTSYVTSGVYTTTSSAATSSAATTTAITPVLTFTFNGQYWILDKNGNIISSNTFEWLPVSGGGGNITSIRYVVDYSVEGQGINWATLDVNIHVDGLTAQPSDTDANVPVVLNTVAGLDSVSHGTAKTGHIDRTVSLDSLIGGKPFSKSKTLSAAITVSGKATAKVVQGLSIGGSDTATVDRAPVVAITHLRWHEQEAPTPTPTPTPTPSATITPAAAPSTTYTSTIVRDVRDRPGGGTDWEHYEPQWGHHYGYSLLSLLGWSPNVISIYGADSSASTGFGETELGLIVALVVVAGIGVMFQRRRKRRSGIS